MWDSIGRSIAGILLAAAWTVTSSADEVIEDVPNPAEIPTVAIVEAKSIQNENGDFRVLLRPGDFSQFDGELVLSASLEIPLSGLPISEEVTVRVYPLTREWSSAADWNSPWETPGGDVDENYLPTATLSSANDSASLLVDVTDVVRAWADAELAKNGFVLTVPPSTGEGLAEADAANLGNLSNAKIYIDYRKISTLGFEGGSNALLHREGASRDQSE